MKDPSPEASLSREAKGPAKQKGRWDSLWARLRRREPTLRESLEDVIEEHSDAASELTAEERIMLMNIINLRELQISDVMVPRADIVAIDMATPFDGLVQAFREAAHSRLPIYNETLDDVTGMVHIKDVLSVLGDPEQAGAPPAVADIKRRVLFVPPSMPVVDLLLRMRLSRIHMALVIDEYGGTDGLVTIEDLIEQIVGEIEDEHDEKLTPLITVRSNGAMDIDARCPMEDLESRLGLDLLPPDRDEYVDTVGGLVFALAGRVPARGEIVTHPDGLEFEVLDVDARRLKRVRLHRRKPPAP